MTTFQQTLQEFHHNLNTLREREAKYADNAPLDLLNEITDHKQAIGLTEQARQGQLSETDWRESLRPVYLRFVPDQYGDAQ